MSDFIGKNEYDFGALETLPTGYLNQIKNMLVNSNIKLNIMGSSDVDVQVYKEGDDNKDLVIGIQGGKNQTQYLYFNSRHFMFNYIPMSKEQQMVFVRNMFLMYVSKRITEMCIEKGFDFNISEYHIEVRKIINSIY